MVNSAIRGLYEREKIKNYVIIIPITYFYHYKLKQLPTKHGKSRSINKKKFLKVKYDITRTLNLFRVRLRKPMNSKHP